MKKSILLCTLLFTIMFSMTAFAGQWKQNDTGWWYQNDDGSYKTGWYQDVDSKWYYFDTNTGYMLTNAQTPDGYTVDASGVWVKGASVSSINNDEYDNNVSLTVSAFSSPGSIDKLGYDLPVTVHYNTTSKDVFGESVQLQEIEVSKDGVAYLKYKMNGGDVMRLKAICRYGFKDGSYIDKDYSLGFSTTDDSQSTPLFRSHSGSPISAEIWIKSEP